MEKKIYLASPYSHPAPAIREERYRLVCKAAAALREYYPPPNYRIFSPVAHTHTIGQYLNNSNDLNFWMQESLSFLKDHHELWVLKIDGWERSRGVAIETARAKAWGMPVHYVRYQGNEVEVI